MSHPHHAARIEPREVFLRAERQIRLELFEADFERSEIVTALSPKLPPRETHQKRVAFDFQTNIVEASVPLTGQRVRVRPQLCQQPGSPLFGENVGELDAFAVRARGHTTVWLKRGTGSHLSVACYTLPPCVF